MSPADNQQETAFIPPYNMSVDRITPPIEIGDELSKNINLPTDPQELEALIRRAKEQIEEVRTMDMGSSETTRDAP